MPIDWYAESVRLTYFVAREAPQSELFTKLTSLPAQQVTSRPVLRTLQEMGPLAGSGYLTISQQVGRIDIIVSDLPSQNVANPSGPNYKAFFWIDKFNPAMDVFNGLIDASVSHIPETTRIAFSVTLIFPTISASEALKALKSALPTVQFDPSKDKDLVFQINRPRVGAGGSLINRLSRWETLQSGIIQIVPGIPATVPITTGPPDFAARAYIDINTPEDSPPIPSTTIRDTIRELQSLAYDIATNGDVP